MIQAISHTPSRLKVLTQHIQKTKIPGSRFLTWAHLAALLLVAGCTAQASERREISLTDLPAQSLDETQQVWQSAPWYGLNESVPWIDYPGQVTLVLEHPLSRIPYSVLVYLSFDSSGQSAGLAAGDLAHIKRVDATHIEIHNSTRSNMYARIVAR